MRGMFVAVMVMGAVWTGGLVWSVFGGMVLVPQSAITIAGAKTATAPPPQTAAQVAQAKASTNATAQAAGPGRRGIGRRARRGHARRLARRPGRRRRRRATSPWSRSSWTA